MNEKTEKILLFLKNFVIFFAAACVGAALGLAMLCRDRLNAQQRQIDEIIAAVKALGSECEAADERKNNAR